VRVILPKLLSDVVGQVLCIVYQGSKSNHSLMQKYVEPCSRISARNSFAESLDDNTALV